MICKTFWRATAAAIVIFLMVISVGDGSAGEPGSRSGVLEWTESIPSGGAGAGVPMVLVGRAQHLRVSTSSGDIKFYGVEKFRNSSGQLTSTTYRKPFGEAGSFPDATDVVWGPLSAAFATWNEYANVFVDSLFVYNVGAGATDVTFQIILE